MIYDQLNTLKRSIFVLQLSASPLSRFSFLTCASWGRPEACRIPNTETTQVNRHIEPTVEIPYYLSEHVDDAVRGSYCSAIHRHSTSPAPQNAHQQDDVAQTDTIQSIPLYKEHPDEVHSSPSGRCRWS